MAGALPRAEIERTMGTRARDPIRVYVGLESAPTPAARAQLAAAELARLGALDRPRVVVASPTGRGWLNPVAVEAEEYMSRGEVATVVVQYANRRSYRSTAEVSVGRDTHRLVLGAVRARIDALAGRSRPELAVYAESLGAWASLAAVATAGTEGPRRLGIERGLWVGVPHGAGAHLARLVPDARQPPADVLVFGGAHELARALEGKPVAARYLVLTRPDDPVATFPGLRVAWRPVGPAAAAGRWRPLLSFARGLLEVKRATDFVPGRLDADGHDYRGDLAAVLRVAFGHRDVTPAQLARIESRLLDNERRRAAREAPFRRRTPPRP
ncbi:MAG: alpha/beta-hydrolase family protein [Actinomycetota bacterium]|nr:alpha/beta-hydrolase family protein [Actinomycetota bacterium]